MTYLFGLHSPRLWALLATPIVLKVDSGLRADCQSSEAAPALHFGNSLSASPKVHPQLKCRAPSRMVKQLARQPVLLLFLLYRSRREQEQPSRTRCSS